MTGVIGQQPHPLKFIAEKRKTKLLSLKSLNVRGCGKDENKCMIIERNVAVMGLRRY